MKHKCIICGIEYDACDTCNSLKRLTPWKTITDTQNHYKIHLIITDFAYKLISKKEAKQELKKCNIKGWENYSNGASRLIEEIILEEQDLKVKD